MYIDRILGVMDFPSVEEVARAHDKIVETSTRHCIYSASEYEVRHLGQDTLVTYISAVSVPFEYETTKGDIILLALKHENGPHKADAPWFDEVAKDVVSLHELEMKFDEDTGVKYTKSKRAIAEIGPDYFVSYDPRLKDLCDGERKDLEAFRRLVELLV